MKIYNGEARAVGAAPGFDEQIRKLDRHNDIHPAHETQALEGERTPPVVAAGCFPDRRGGWRRVGDVAMALLEDLARRGGGAR
jgi:hypothetical protein